MQGQMQSYPLTLVHPFERAERLFPDKPLISATPTGIQRTTYGQWAERTRRLGGVLDALGVSADGRVGTFAWNSARHLELYFAAPCTGRVLHTLNIRLFPEQQVYIANHAEDDVVFVDRSLLPIFTPLRPQLRTVRHVIVIDDGSDCPVPDDAMDYDALLASAEPPQRMRRSADRSCSLSSGTAPSQMVGTPAVMVTRWRSSRPSTPFGDMFGPGNTMLDPASSAAYGSPHALAWNIGTTGMTMSRSRRPGPSTVSEISECSSVDRWL